MSVCCTTINPVPLTTLCTALLFPACRRWWDAAGPVPYKDGQKLGPMLPREKILDHYNSHVLRCPDCQKELKNLRKKQETARIASKCSCLQATDYCHRDVV